jgi:hypothetical protein
MSTPETIFHVTGGSILIRHNPRKSAAELAFLALHLAKRQLAKIKIHAPTPHLCHQLFEHRSAHVGL